MTICRLSDLRTFYQILGRLKKINGGMRYLANCNGRMKWPERGVYFFHEDGEVRQESGNGFRVVRVGTHGLKTGSKATIWKRLSQHKGAMKTGGGNHRGSIFRKIVGYSLIERDNLTCSTWGQGSSAPTNVVRSELWLEKQVTPVIGAMPFTWLEIDDEPKPDSLRGYIETNSIALLSNYEKERVDSPSKFWLGHNCPTDLVRRSGQWNSNHVKETYNPGFLETFAELVDKMEIKQ